MEQFGTYTNDDNNWLSKLPKPINKMIFDYGSIIVCKTGEDFRCKLRDNNIIQTHTHQHFTFGKPLHIRINRLFDFKCINCEYTWTHAKFGLENGDFLIIIFASNRFIRGYIERGANAGYINNIRLLR